MVAPDGPAVELKGVIPHKCPLAQRAPCVGFPEKNQGFKLASWLIGTGADWVCAGNRELTCRVRRCARRLLSFVATRDAELGGSMRLRIVPAALVLACSSNGAQSNGPEAVLAVPPSMSVTEFRGMYSAGFEVSAFRPCGSNEKWWVSDPGPLHTAYNRLNPAPYQEIYAVVRGDTSGIGQVGHLGLYTRYLSVDSLVEARLLTDTTRAIQPGCS
jgi:hypothetical protein